MEVCVTFSGNTDDINVVAHCSTRRAKLFTEDHGLNPNLKAVKHERDSVISCSVSFCGFDIKL